MLSKAKRGAAPGEAVVGLGVADDAVIFPLHGIVDEHGAGPANVAAFVKGCKDIGAKAVKFLISGESALKPGASMELLYTDEEIKAYGTLPSGAQLLRKPVDMGWLRGYFQAMLTIRMGPKRRPSMSADVA